MNIDVALRELGAVDSGPLRDAILAQDADAWLEDEYRQEAFEVHHSTQSIVMLFVDIERWPEIVVKREPGWPRLADTALPLMNSIIERGYPGGKITPHVDRHPSFHCGHRIHIPITTNPRVRFMIDGQPYQFKVGEAYEINNQKTHSVMNKGGDDRITFIFDYVPAGEIA
jgi:hypothetical protein